MRALIIVLALTLFSLSASAQVKFGVKAGISTIDLAPNQLVLKDQNNLDDLGLTLSNVNYGFHFGIFTQIKMKKFFIQPEVLFNTNAYDFQLDDLSSGTSGVLETVKSESYQHLDIPILIGVAAGPFRLNAGPVGHLFINSTSELTDIEGYKQSFEKMTYGWQAGVGVDIWKVAIDVRYEGNFNKFGNHITYNDTAYNFDDNPGRFLISAGIKF